MSPRHQKIIDGNYQHEPSRLLFPAKRKCHSFLLNERHNYFGSSSLILTFVTYARLIQVDCKNPTESPSQSYFHRLRSGATARAIASKLLIFLIHSRRLKLFVFFFGKSWNASNRLMRRIVYFLRRLLNKWRSHLCRGGAQHAYHVYLRFQVSNTSQVAPSLASNMPENQTWREFSPLSRPEN